MVFENKYTNNFVCPSKLTLLQCYVIDEFSKLEYNVVLLDNKGLGPAVKERYTSVAACLSPLINDNNHKQLDKINACFQSQKTVGKVEAWMKKFNSVLSNGDKKYLVDSLALCDE